MPELCPYGEGDAPGAGCIRNAGHDGPHYYVPGDVPLDPDDD